MRARRDHRRTTGPFCCARTTGALTSHLRHLLVLTVLTGSAAHGLRAQGATGKIQGTVLDPAGQPLVGAQVSIVGTSLAAFTSETGYYFFNNVPAGVYAVRAQFIGYQPTQSEDARVLADQTLEVNLKLSGAVTLEAVTIVSTAVPIVPRDQVATKSIVTGEDVGALPVDDVQDIVKLQPGVVEARGGEISIRGSRTREAAIFIDGVPVRRMDTGFTFINLPTNTLAEVSVTTGAMEASFGDAQAGVISFVTRGGGPTYTGSFSYETDEPTGRSTRTGLNRFEAAVSGPIVGNLTFSVGGVLHGEKGSDTRKGMEDVPLFTYMGIDTIVHPVSGSDTLAQLIPHYIQWGGACDAGSNLDLDGNPVPCQGRVRPYTWDTSLRASGKLQYTYGGGSHLSFSAITNQTQGRTALVETDQESGRGYRTTSNVFVLNWVQRVFRRRESELSWDVSLSYQNDRNVSGAIVRDMDLTTRSPALGIVLRPLEFVTDWDRFGPGDPATHLSRDSSGGYVITRLETEADWEALIENVRYDRGTLRSYLGREEVWGEIVPRLNPYGLIGYGFWNSGVDWGQTYVYENRFVGRATVDWQADRYNRFKFGAEGTQADLGRWQMGWVVKAGGNAYTGNPYKFALYAQDRLDLGDVVVELGVRWDRYDMRSIFPLVPGRVFSSPAFDRTATVADMTCPRAANACDVSTYVWAASRPHSALAPRLRVSFPITDRTGFRLSYAHQTQVPDIVDMYNGANNDVVNGLGTFGGDVDLERTIQFEFGIRHAFSRDLVLDLSAYNKDKIADVAYRLIRTWDPVFDDTVDVARLTNADRGVVRGFEIQLLQRVGRVFSGQASYSFQNASSTGSDPYDYIGRFAGSLSAITGERVEPVQVILRTRDDRRHNIQGTFSITVPGDAMRNPVASAVFGRVGVFGTLQFRSGLPYTRVRNSGLFITSSGGGVDGIIEPLQSSETPWEKYVNLRVTKDFRVGPVDWTLYADIRNLFDFTNTVRVFANTGGVENELNRELWYDDLIKNELDARASGVWITIDKPDGAAGTRSVGAIDLTDLSATCPGWKGSDGVVGCVMLQRTERRFGNGDGIYDVDEQRAAIDALYDLWRGPTTFVGAGRTVRLGVQVTF